MVVWEADRTMQIWREMGRGERRGEEKVFQREGEATYEPGWRWTSFRMKNSHQKRGFERDGEGGKNLSGR